MSCKTVVVVGGANMDIVASTNSTLAMADSTPGHIACAAGGVARNVAENLARMGDVVHLISAVGDDVFGRSLLTTTSQAGVLVNTVQVMPQERTATYLSVHGADGDMALAVNDMAILERMTPEVLQGHRSLFALAACTVLDSNLSSAALEWLFDTRSKVPFFVDGVSVVKCMKLAPWISQIHTLKVNRLEAAALSGLPVKTPADAVTAAQRLHQMGVTNVVVSLGDQGVCWCDAQGAGGHWTAGQVPVVNTSGAGDALLAGLVHAYLCDLPLATAVKFAMACAELTLSSTFANAPELSLRAIEARLTAGALPV